MKILAKLFLKLALRYIHFYSCFEHNESQIFSFVSENKVAVAEMKCIQLF